MNKSHTTPSVQGRTSPTHSELARELLYKADTMRRLSEARRLYKTFQHSLSAYSSDEQITKLCEVPVYQITLAEQYQRQFDLELEEASRPACGPVPSVSRLQLGLANRFSLLSDLEEEKYSESPLDPLFPVNVPQAPQPGPIPPAIELKYEDEFLEAILSKRRNLKKVAVLSRRVSWITSSELKAQIAKMRSNRVNRPDPERPFFGPRPNPNNPYSSPELDESRPSERLLGNRDRRVIVVRDWAEYEFTLLDFLGYWNATPFSSNPSFPFARHYGFHFAERMRSVRLPSSLVDEMKDWWSARDRDVKGENYQLSVARCKVLTSELDLSADELVTANLYAPAIAFIDSWDEQQNVSRVVSRSYFASSLSATYKKICLSLRSKWAKRGLIGGIFLSHVVVGCLFRKFQIESEPVVLEQRRIQRTGTYIGEEWQSVPPLIGIEISTKDVVTRTVRQKMLANFVNLGARYFKSQDG